MKENDNGESEGSCSSNQARAPSSISPSPPRKSVIALCSTAARSRFSGMKVPAEGVSELDQNFIILFFLLKARPIQQIQPKSGFRLSARARKSTGGSLPSGSSAIGAALGIPN